MRRKCTIHTPLKRYSIIWYSGAMRYPVKQHAAQGQAGLRRKLGSGFSSYMSMIAARRWKKKRNK